VQCAIIIGSTVFHFNFSTCFSNEIQTDDAQKPVFIGTILHCTYSFWGLCPQTPTEARSAKLSPCYCALHFPIVPCHGGHHEKVGGTNSGAENFFTVPPNFFVVPPMTGHYRKAQGTVTRTGLGQRWPTVGSQSDLWLFMLCQRWSRQSIEHEAWVVSYRSSVDTNSVSCSVFEILHLNPQTYFWCIKYFCCGVSAMRYVMQENSPTWPTDLLALSVICMM